MKINGYHHIGLFVQDAEKSLRFYTQGLGGKETFHWQMKDFPDRTIYLVDLGGGAVVEIVPRGEGKEEQDAHWAHIALSVEDAREAFDQAVRAGAAVRSEPGDSMLGTMAVRNAFVLGPDREVIEFFQVK